MRASVMAGRRYSLCSRIESKPRTPATGQAWTHPCTSLTPSYWQGKPRVTRALGMWIAGGRSRTLGARDLPRPPTILGSAKCLPGLPQIHRRRSPLLGKQWSTILQCDTTGEVAMTYKHAARDLAPIQRLTLHSVDLLRGADHLNTQKTRRLHQVTSQSTRDTANPGPKRTHAARETSAA